MFEQKAARILLNYVVKNYKRINVTPGGYLMNFRCHLNSVHQAMIDKDDKIAAVFYTDGLGLALRPILHFVNVKKHPEKNVSIFIDNTLGHFASITEYYFISYIEKQKFREIVTIFKEMREDIHKQLPWHVRKLTKFEI